MHLLTIGDPENYASENLRRGFIARRALREDSFPTEGKRAS